MVPRVTETWSVSGVDLIKLRANDESKIKDKVGSRNGGQQRRAQVQR